MCQRHSPAFDKSTARYQDSYEELKYRGWEHASGQVCFSPHGLRAVPHLLPIKHTGTDRHEATPLTKLCRASPAGTFLSMRAQRIRAGLKPITYILIPLHQGANIACHHPLHISSTSADSEAAGPNPCCMSQQCKYSSELPCPHACVALERLSTTHQPTDYIGNTGDRHSAVLEGNSAAFHGCFGA